MDNKELYRDISDHERTERDWQREQRAEALFLDETYNDWARVRVCDNCRKITDTLFNFFGFAVCEVCAEEPAVHSRGEQLNLFEEAA
jgi:hypothetical protein